MSKTYAQIEARIRNNINNQTAVVSTIIDDAINFLSNFFHTEKIDTSISTVIGQKYITKPTNCKEILRLEIGGNEYKKTFVGNLTENTDFELKRFLDINDQIQIQPTPSVVAVATIHFKKKFTELAGVAGAVSDVPDNLIPMLCAIATWFFWQQIATQTATQRELFPDMTPEEALENAKSWKEQFETMLKY